MSDSSSSQSTKPYPDPPSATDDPGAWGRWAVEFLHRLCLEWGEWEGTWTVHDVPDFSQGHRDRWCILGRESRYVGTTPEFVTGRPPRGISQAAPLLEVCSEAVRRFSAKSAWRFAPPERAYEVVYALLEIARTLKKERYSEVSQEKLEELSQLVGMAVAAGSHDPAKPYAIGYVARPADPSSYVPMATILAKHCDEIALTTIKEMIRVLEEFSTNRVSWTRPLSKKTGDPHPQRRSVHLADWERYVDRLKHAPSPTAETGFPDLSPPEIEARSSKVRHNRQAGK